LEYEVELIWDLESGAQAHTEEKFKREASQILKNIS
jgi:hypothetical protein